MDINLKQPKDLYLFSLVDLWERYGFYTMSTILVLYMTKVFSFTNAHAYSIFAAFSALLYLTPILGGYVADRWLNSKNAVIFGGLILAIGYALLAIPGTKFFFYGLATIIVGSGLFMPNIAAMVSSLYKIDDIRREGGFSLFYTAINIGAFIPPITVAIVIYVFGWNAAFLMASIGVLIGVTIFSMVTLKYKTIAANLNLNLLILLLLVLIASIYLISKLVDYTFYANLVLFSFSVIFILFTFLKSFKYPRQQRNKLIACLILIILSIIFSVLYQQAGMSLTIYTEYNVQRHIGSWFIPTVMFRSLNPLYIVLLGPILAFLWLKLGEKNINPSVPIKFGLGSLIMGLSFVIIPFAIMTRSSAGLINPWWIVLSYFLQAVGEMLVSPIGLSMVSELSPVKMVGVMMGTWYFATAVADALAGIVSRWTTLPSNTNDPVLTSLTYSHVFGKIGVVAVIAGILIICISPLLNKIINSR